MNIDIRVNSIVLRDLFSIPMGGTLLKGGKKVNSEIWGACEAITDQFCCYYWRDDISVRYVGSVTAEYTSTQYKTNLCGRIGNYLQNHNGQTNKRVFDNVNANLVTHNIHFGIFRFGSTWIDGVQYHCQQCIVNQPIMQMFEEILICRYRLLGQADWNRT